MVVAYLQEIVHGGWEWLVRLYILSLAYSSQHHALRLNNSSPPNIDSKHIRYRAFIGLMAVLPLSAMTCFVLMLHVFLCLSLMVLTSILNNFIVVKTRNFLTFSAIIYNLNCKPPFCHLNTIHCSYFRWVYHTTGE